MGQVVGVTDGDTIRVMRNGEAVKVRLYGIDCPEKNQAFGSRAKQFTSELCFSKEVAVRVMDTDRYGRIIGDDALPSRRNLNREIVKAGFAWWYEEYAPDDKVLKQFQTNARLAKLGLWVDPSPIPPWDFRRRK